MGQEPLGEWDGRPRPASQKYLSAEEIATWPVGAPRPVDQAPKAPLAEVFRRQGLNGPLQMAGRHFAMGCVALEITQRCNLDCTLCYLSDQSEAVHDLPLAEIYRRIDRIRHDFGPHTNVQITGGDPTLRERTDLIAIVRRVRERDMVPALFTNGIKATRPLLKGLAEAGLRDVAFHVDMTQERRGFASEKELNRLRRDYIDRAKGLGLHILFNTTVFDGNVQEVEALARFFLEEAPEVRMASFQLQAETGRGVLGSTSGPVTVDGVWEALEAGAGASLGGAWPLIGHPDCNRYGTLLTAGKSRVPLFTNKNLWAALFVEGEALQLSRHHPWSALRQVAGLLRRRPLLVGRSALSFARKGWALRRGLIASRGRVRKLTFYLHNFMDAAALERDRCEACVFMTATRDGPIAMCVHNAKRDSFISQPIKQAEGGVFHPLPQPAETMPAKKLKGRLRRLVG